MSKRLNLFVGITISSLALTYFVFSTPDNILDAFFNHQIVILIGCLILVPVYFLRAVKYYLILQPYQVSFKSLAGVQFAGIALNNLLPFRMGDILRTGYLYQSLDVPIKDAIISLFIERGIDFGIILLLLISFCIIFFPSDIFYFFAAFSSPMAILLVALVGFGLAYWHLPEVHRFNVNITKKLLGLWPLNFINTLAVLIVAFLQWCLEIILLGTVLSTFVLDSSPSVGVLATFFSNLSTLIPSAPGYLGTFEAAGISAFHMVKFTDLKSAASFVLVLHASIWLFSTTLGIIAMLVLPNTLTFLRRQNN